MQKVKLLFFCGIAGIVIWAPYAQAATCGGFDVKEEDCATQEVPIEGGCTWDENMGCVPVNPPQEDEGMVYTLGGEPEIYESQPVPQEQEAQSTGGGGLLGSLLSLVMTKPVAEEIFVPVGTVQSQIQPAVGSAVEPIIGFAVPEVTAPLGQIGMLGNGVSFIMTGRRNRGGRKLI